MKTTLKQNIIAAALFCAVAFNPMHHCLQGVF
jgi:hypothetical protein